MLPNDRYPNLPEVNWSRKHPLSNFIQPSGHHRAGAIVVVPVVVVEVAVVMLEVVVAGVVLVDVMVVEI